MDDTAEWLSRLCAIFAARTRRRLSTVSRLATGSGQTIARLKSGRTITIRRAARAFQYLSDHWPDDQEWPTEIPRPKAVLGKARPCVRRSAVRGPAATSEIAKDVAVEAVVERFTEQVTGELHRFQSRADGIRERKAASRPSRQAVSKE